MADKTAASDAFWADYRDHAGAAGDYAVCSFGDNAADAAELAALVLAGTKRATASLVRDYSPDTLPREGDHVVVVDGEGRPCCIWRTTRIETKPMIEVDDAFAWAEGEGDRSRAEWLRIHRDYFGAQARSEGFAIDDGIEVVFERFRIVWPQQFADAPEPD
ncbi:ASCH domain-containing protein [Pseudomonas sp. CGJS7]|uniref:ASCH domain-containing protein n=1 Tax=Pseudomonas sp. CGJS7 TaxID=3109348 RepID=UPI003009F6E1